MNERAKLRLPLYNFQNKFSVLSLIDSVMTARFVSKIESRLPGILFLPPLRNTTVIRSDQLEI